MTLKASNEKERNSTSLEFSGDRQICIRRRFNAPAHIVFRTWVEPQFVRQWWAPKSQQVEMVVCRASVQVGGTFRYVIRDMAGQEFAFSGVYHEIVPSKRLVYTQCFEPMSEEGKVEITVSFFEHAGCTDVESVETYASKEALQAALSAGLEHGMRDSLQQLEELLAHSLLS